MSERLWKSSFLLGFGAGAVGHLINSHAFFLACGGVVVLFGLHQTGLVSIPFLNKDKRPDVRYDSRSGPRGAFLPGFLFSFGWTPCVGPVLGAELGISSRQGNVLTGGRLLLVYSPGLSLPFFILAVGLHLLLGKMRRLCPHFGKIGLRAALSGIGQGAGQSFPVPGENDLRQIPGDMVPSVSGRS